MNDATRRLLVTSHLRASPAYDLLVYDELSSGEQATFSDLCRDPEFYGLLRPREGHERTMKSVNCDTALLLLTVARSGRLPHFATRDEASLNAIVDLIIGGLVELEHEGEFVGAETAVTLLSSPHAMRDDHRLTRLSLNALRLAAADPSLGSSRIAASLYQFNRQPSSPRIQRLLPDREGVLSYVGLASGSEARRAIASTWDIDGQQASRAWIYVNRRRSGGAAAIDPRAATYKLYVSPVLKDFPAVFRTVLDIATRMDVAHLKLGSDVMGLLRPDKLVIYFPSLERLLAVAREAERTLHGISAQGVPFTAPIDDLGLLSWGVDPPEADSGQAWQSRESWRSYLAVRLATALTECRTSDVDANMRFALDRLRRDGVDTDRWIASATMWNAA
ncbi:MAG: hypothetical protein ABJE47_05155 [bacterium]